MLDNKRTYIFRLEDWFWSKVSLLMGVIYLLFSYKQFPFIFFFSRISLWFITIIGFASLGYFVNDFFDSSQDLIANKKNSLQDKSRTKIFLIFSLSLMVAIIPWLFLPFTKFTFFLIAFQIGLYLAYSVPPIRLKERGLIGIFADSLYAYVSPILLIIYTFTIEEGFHFTPLFLVVFVMWHFLTGVRNILLHQEHDLAADKKAGVRNYVSNISVEKLYKVIPFIIAGELFFSLASLFILMNRNVVFCLAFFTMVIAFLKFIDLYYHEKIKRIADSEWRYFPNIFFEKWLPLIYLVILSYQNFLFLNILLLHILLFNYDLFKKVTKKLILILNAIPFKQIFKNTLHFFIQKASWLVNHFIFLVFLLFGVDLKREKTDAKGYILKKLNKQK